MEVDDVHKRRVENLMGLGLPGITRLTVEEALKVRVMRRKSALHAVLTARTHAGLQQ